MLPKMHLTEDFPLDHISSVAPDPTPVTEEITSCQGATGSKLI